MVHHEFAALIGCDLTTIPQPSLDLLKNEELIALNQDPLGLQAYVVQRRSGAYVLVKDIEKRRDNTRAVALYNPSDSACHVSVPLSELELAGKVKLRDLIRRRNIDSATDSLSYNLPPRSVMILRAEGERRLEPRRYEAEWGYLPCFDALGKREKQVLYAFNENASGSMVVSYLGGRKENILRWDNVYSEQGRRLPDDHQLHPCQTQATGSKHQRSDEEANRLTGERGNSYRNPPR